jgi:hypothetical protein
VVFRRRPWLGMPWSGTIICCLFQDIDPCELAHDGPLSKGPQVKAISRIALHHGLCLLARMSQLGQNAKYSSRVDVFRFASNFRRSSMRSVLRPTSCPNRSVLPPLTMMEHCGLSSLRRGDQLLGLFQGWRAAEAEIAALSDALNEQGDRAAADCLRFIMVTGCRPGEAMKATWTQMEVEPGYWVKRSAHTKQRKVHRVPLSPPALALLEQLRERRPANDKNPHVFPGQIAGAPIAQIWAAWYGARDRATIALWKSREPVAKMLADLEAGLKRISTIEECKALAEHRGIVLPVCLLDTRPYDLRHTFASVGAGGGLSLHIIGKLLGHTQARTTQRYAHLADDPLREATRTIGAVISGAGQPSAKLLAIKG